MWETICDAWACWSGWNFGPNSTEYPYSEIQFQNTPPPPKMKIFRDLGTLTFQFQKPPPSPKNWNLGRSWHFKIFQFQNNWYQWQTMCGNLPHVETLSSPDNYSLCRYMHSLFWSWEWVPWLCYVVIILSKVRKCFFVPVSMLQACQVCAQGLRDVIYFVYCNCPPKKSS